MVTGNLHCDSPRVVMYQRSLAIFTIWLRLDRLENHGSNGEFAAARHQRALYRSSSTERPVCNVHHEFWLCIEVFSGDRLHLAPLYSLVHPPLFHGLLTMTSPPLPPSTSPLAKSSAAGEDSLIEYPSLFPIKVMGANAEGLVAALTEVAERFDPQFDASTIALRESRAGNYLGVTLNVMATSRAQLDDLYRALSSHPMVKVVL